jgi:hypothetical protein
MKIIILTVIFSYGYLSLFSQSILGESTNGTAVRGISEEGQGVNGTSSTWWGVRGTSNSSYGVYGSSTSSYGVYGQSNNDIGVRGVSISSHGVYGYSESDIGVFGFSFASHGAYFRGDKLGGFADIVLGASSNTNTGDNGVIMSDPDFPGSDIFLRSNDAVIIELDDNFGDEGNFEVWNANDQVVLRALEDGQFEIWDGGITNERILLMQPDGDLFIDGNLSQGSDRNRKENITDVSYSNILDAINRMPIYEWQYIGQNRRHIGPMAQDFHQAFNLGDDDKTIATIDADGVALAAIKAQQEIIEDQEKRINQQESELNFLRQEIAELKSWMPSDVSLRRTK